MKQLNAALQKNKLAYEQMANAEKRESTEGKELLKVITAQDQQLKKLKESIGENQLKVGQYENATKNLKMELKKAKDEMVGIAQTLGVDSDEFKEAAEKAGELQNEMGDLNASMKAVSGSKFENLGDSLSLVGTKLKAADFKGAAGALAQFRGTIKDISFKEVTSGAGAFGKQMLLLGKQILFNPIILIAAVIIAIGAAVWALKDKIPFLTKAFDVLERVLIGLYKKEKSFPIGRSAHLL